MKFVYPWMLVLVALVPVAGAFWTWQRARTERRLDGLVARSLRARLLPRNPRLFNLQAALLLTGLLLVVFAASRPQWGHSQQKLQAKARNVVVALDVSRSMLAADVRPNRLERAKADVADLVDSLEGDRCALVAFRRTGVLTCPLTTDHAFLRSALEKAGPESAPRGETDLGGAIRTALDALDPAADDHNAILLISDGGDLRGGALDAARAAAKRNVPIFTVGLGNPKASSAIPDASGAGSQQYKGQAVMTKLEEKALVEIAKASGGRYVPLATAGTAETTLGAIYRRYLRQVAAKEQAEEEELRATERFGWFLVPGLLLMLVAGVFSRGRFAGSSTRAAAAAACLLLCLGLQAEDATNGAPAVAEVVETNAAAAVELPASYTPPAETQLSDREIWNRGYDYWKAGDMTNALATLQPLTLSRTHGARAAEVVGAILHGRRRADLEQGGAANAVHAEGAALEPMRRALKAGEASLQAMQLALRAQPDDPRANRNFARAAAGLDQLRDDVHREEVLAQAKNRRPDEMLDQARKEALELLEAQAGVLTNEAGVAVARSESLARRAEKLADALIPLKRHVLESVTNEQQAATIVGDVEATRDAVLKAAEQLGDMDPAAAVELGKSETAFHRYWKGTLQPPAALAEAVHAQTNACAGTAPRNGRDWQQEACEFAALFKAGLPGWVQQSCAQDAATASNRPPYTLELAGQVAQEVDAFAKDQAELAQQPAASRDKLKQLDVRAKLDRAAERFGQLTLEPPQLIDADILMQTNAYMDVDEKPLGNWQRDAGERTKVFRAKFPAWAQMKEQEIQQKIQQGDTNAVPFTKEAQAEVAKLAAEVEAIQDRMVQTVLPPEQLKALEKLARIRELLPKDNGGGQGQNNPQQNPQQKPDENKDKNQDPDQQKNDQEPPKDDQQQEQPKEEKAPAEEPKDLKDVEDLLRKAQERSDEHENEKKARMNRAPLAPNERDW
ncbi:MAG: VWA domain-containing protein [Kiritimatiellae bacterium]|nr:VWA domain-containing protein [Kiritimatiellia bacterium]